MTNEKEDLEREAFEEWYCSSISESIGLERYPNGCFCNPEAENMYLAWCAAKSHAEKSKWISVEDRMPEHHSLILAAWRPLKGGSYRVDAFIYDATSQEYSSLNSGNKLNNKVASVTYWQPLPEPPEQGDKK